MIGAWWESADSTCVSAATPVPYGSNAAAPPAAPPAPPTVPCRLSRLATFCRDEASADDDEEIPPPMPPPPPAGGGAGVTSAMRVVSPSSAEAKIDGRSGAEWAAAVSSDRARADTCGTVALCNSQWIWRNAESAGAEG